MRDGGSGDEAGGDASGGYPVEEGELDGGEAGQLPNVDRPEGSAPVQGDGGILPRDGDDVPPATTGDVGTDGIRAIICKPAYSWPCGEAIGVFTCESGLDPLATGKAGEKGIAQIHPIHKGNFDWERAYEPKVNLDYAYRLWLDSGWAPWACSRSSY